LLSIECFVPLREAVQIGADEGFGPAKAILCLKSPLALHRDLECSAALAQVLATCLFFVGAQTASPQRACSTALASRPQPSQWVDAKKAATRKGCRLLFI